MFLHRTILFPDGFGESFGEFTYENFKIENVLNRKIKS